MKVKFRPCFQILKVDPITRFAYKRDGKYRYFPVKLSFFKFRTKRASDFLGVEGTTCYHFAIYLTFYHLKATKQLCTGFSIDFLFKNAMKSDTAIDLSKLRLRASVKT